MTTIVHLTPRSPLLHKTKIYWMVCRVWSGHPAPTDRKFTVLEALKQCNELIVAAPPNSHLKVRALELRDVIVKCAHDGKKYWKEPVVKEPGK